MQLKQRPALLVSTAILLPLRPLTAGGMPPGLQAMHLLWIHVLRGRCVAPLLGGVPCSRSPGDGSSEGEDGGRAGEVKRKDFQGRRGKGGGQGGCELWWKEKIGR